MTAYPGNAQIRVLSPNAAGMTGGTLTKDGNMIGTFPYNVAAAVGGAVWAGQDLVNPDAYSHPVAYAQNEGFILENSILNVTSYGIAWYIDFEWVEVIGRL
jgi:hypothetical protein